MSYYQPLRKAKKTSLPLHTPGINPEINMKKGNGLFNQKIYPLGAEELETVQECIKTNQDRG